MFKKSVFAVLCSVVLLGAASDGMAAFTGEYSDPYYKARPQFHFYPSHDVARFTIDHIGPIGMGHRHN